MAGLKLEVLHPVKTKTTSFPGFRESPCRRHISFFLNSKIVSFVISNDYSFYVFIYSFSFNIYIIFIFYVFIFFSFFIFLCGIFYLFLFFFFLKFIWTFLSNLLLNNNSGGKKK